MVQKWTTTQIEERVRALGPWFHNLDLGGVKTAPDHFLGDFPRVLWRYVQDVLPDLHGKSVLDIGCNAGFYSLQAKQRGAARVVGIDIDERYLAQARLAAEVTGHDIELHQMSVYDVGALREKFDLVVFMGVLYHLRHPLLALDLIHDHVAKDTVIFQTMTRGSHGVMPIADDYPIGEEEIFNDPRYPKLHFIEKRYCNDPTNWWTPNRACVEGMLRSSGFDIVDHPQAELFVCRSRPKTESVGDCGAVYPARGMEG